MGSVFSKNSVTPVTERNRSEVMGSVGSPYHPGDTSPEVMGSVGSPYHSGDTSPYSHSERENSSAIKNTDFELRKNASLPNLVECDRDSLEECVNKNDNKETEIDDFIKNVHAECVNKRWPRNCRYRKEWERHQLRIKSECRQESRPGSGTTLVSRSTQTSGDSGISEVARPKSAAVKTQTRHSMNDHVVLLPLSKSLCDLTIARNHEFNASSISIETIHHYHSYQQVGDSCQMFVNTEEQL